MSANQPLDKEWVELITQAKNMGLTLEEIHLYFQTESTKTL